MAVLMSYATHRRCVRGNHDRCPGRARPGLFTTWSVQCFCECHDVPIDRTPSFDVKAWPAGHRHGSEHPLACCWTLDDGSGCTEQGAWDFIVRYGNTGESHGTPYCDLHIDEAMAQATA